MTDQKLFDVVYWKPFKDFIKKEKNKSLKKAMQDAVTQIRLDPEVGEIKSGDLSSVYCLDVRHKTGNYEIAYLLEEDENGDFVIIIMAGSRENFYEALKVYLFNK